MTTLLSGRQLSLELADGCATLTFNNPQALNALSVEMAQECFQATELLLSRDDVRVLMLRGAGRAFVAGGDLQALQSDPAGAAMGIIEPMHACMRQWHAAPWLTLAVVQGAAAGAGLSLVAAADLVVATDAARFVYAYSDIATTPDLGLSWSLVRRIGRSRTLDMALLGRSLSAVQAQEWGLVQRVVSAEQLETELSALLKRMLALDPQVVRATVDLIDLGLHQDLATQLDAEQRSFLHCAARPAFAGAVAAFLAKRR